MSTTSTINLAADKPPEVTESFPDGSALQIIDLPPCPGQLGALIPRSLDLHTAMKCLIAGDFDVYMSTGPLDDWYRSQRSGKGLLYVGLMRVVTVRDLKHGQPVTWTATAQPADD